MTIKILIILIVSDKETELVLSAAREKPWIWQDI